ncbi:MAG: hypothetical protein QXQ02_01375 [Halobacteria archaeon]
MYRVAVRIDIDGSIVDFYQEEIKSVVIAPKQSHELQERQDLPPNLILFGDVWRNIIVNFYERWASTHTKISQVLNADEEIIIYPCYFYNPLINYRVIVLPDNIRKLYRYGELGASIEHRITFLESSK